MMGIKIKLGTANQSEILDLIHRIADHKAVCAECESAVDVKLDGSRCTTARKLFEELREYSEVQPFDERTI